MKVNIVYKSSEVEFISLLNDFTQDVKINSYDLDNSKQVRKGRMILYKYAAKELPFVEILNEDNKLIKHMYSEEKRVTLPLIIDAINKLK